MKLSALLFCLFACTFVLAQDPSTGFPPYGTFEDGHFDSVNRQNLDVNFSIPIVSRQGRGAAFAFSLFYDSIIWQRIFNGTTYAWTPVVDLNGVPFWGWKKDQPFGTVVYGSSTTTIKCFDDHGGWTFGSKTTWSGYRYRATNGTVHNFPVSWTTSCNGDSGTTSATTQDGSGFFINIGSPDSGLSNVVKVIQPDGLQYTGTNTQLTQGLDPNGNAISFIDLSGNTPPESDWKDTVGRIALRIIKDSTSQTRYVVKDSSGNDQTYTLTYSTMNVQTAFGCANVSEYSGTNIVLPTQLTLPTGASYGFQYEPHPTLQNTTTGRLLKVTLPTGGSYEYDYTGNNGGIECATGNILAMTRKISDGITTSNWLFSNNTSTTTTTVTDPLMNDSTYAFTGGALTSVKSYLGSAAAGTLKRTTNMTYSNGSPATTTVITDNNLQSKIATTFDAVGNLLSRDEYAWGAGAVGALFRHTGFTYLNGSAYVAKNIRNRPTDIVVTDGTSKVAETQITYDGSTPSTVSGVVQHDDTNYGSSMNVRGNATAVQRWVSGTTFLSTSATYDTTGQVVTVTDPLGTPTSISYANTFYLDSSTIANPPASYSTTDVTNAYATQVTLPIIGNATAGYYYYTGDVAASSDPNGASFYSHYTEPLGRPTYLFGPLTVPGRVWNINVYTSPTQIDSYRNVYAQSAATTCSSCIKNRATLDGLGRLVSTYLMNDPDGQTRIDATYDSLGRLSSMFNAHRTVSGPTDGTRQFAYDVLGRPTIQTNQDSSTKTTFYSSDVGTNGGITSQLCAAATYGVGYPILTKDEAGKKRQTWTDAAERVIEIDERDTGGNLTVATCYKYDLNNNAVQVVQGSTTRQFSYDGLSRITSSTEPEVGSGGSSFPQNVYYTKSDGTLCAGSVSVPCRKQETGRGITTTYSYDLLNRLTQISYSDSTPAVNYYYDQTLYNNLTITNGIGRRTGMLDGSGKTAWSYDKAGRLLFEKRTISGITKTLTFTYSPGGYLQTYTFPTTNNQLTYTYSNVGRPTALDDLGNNIHYVSGATYFPGGNLKSWTLGVVSGGFAGIGAATAYNNRNQVTSESAGSAFNLSYGYPSPNNGQITSINNLVSGQSNRNSSFGYDQVGRLATAQTTSNLWGNTYVYDQYTNLLQKNLISGKLGYENLTQTANSNNQLNGTGLAYNNSGQMTSYSPQTFTWNGAGQLTSAGGVTYTYDGEGRRVSKSTGPFYWRGTGLSTSDSAGNILDEYIMFNGVPIARRNTASGSVYYNFHDQVGSTRVVTDATGNVCYDVDFYPYGVERTPRMNTCPPAFKFATYERDQESGLDYALTRYYSSALGRFVSPDSAAGDSPESLNKNAYVKGDPINGLDPVGHDCELVGIDTTSPECDHGGLGSLSDQDGWCPISSLGPCGGGEDIPTIYTIDGVRVSADMAEHWLQSGIGVECPANDCTFAQMDGGTLYLTLPVHGSQKYTIYRQLSDGTWIFVGFGDTVSEGYRKVAFPGLDSILQPDYHTLTFTSLFSPRITELALRAKGYAFDSGNPFHVHSFRNTNQENCSTHIDLKGTNANGQAMGDFHSDLWNPYFQPGQASMGEFLMHGTEVAMMPFGYTSPCNVGVVF